MTAHGERTDAYRLFFPLGVATGIAGVSIWPAYYFGLTETYSGRAHAFVQIQGFLYAFVAGFLLTAIPRFTGTDGPRRSVQFVLAAAAVLSSAAFELGLEPIGHAGFLVVQLIVIGLVATRFARRRNPPPETFPLIGIGLITGLCGELINAGIAWQVLPPSLDLLGKRSLTEGMVLLLVLGVGGFLGPRLMGFAQMPDFQSLSTVARNRRPVYAGAGIVIVFGLAAEYGWGAAWGAPLRAAVASALIAETIRPWRLPATRTTLSWCVWTSFLLLVSGLWISALWPPYRVDFLHIVFVGGFSLLILAVGARVTLSHGGHSLAAEQRSWPLRTAAASIVVAMFARIGAPFAPASYFEHLALAALLWIAGASIGGFYLLRLLRARH